jgi:alpha-galactosidase
MMKLICVALVLAVAQGAEDGLARTPPQGWRSWNLYGSRVNQQLIEGIMDGMVKKDRMVDWQDGKGPVATSLLDLGYNDVGLDDNWQKCGDSGAKAAGNNFHDATGAPVVNTDLFPNMKSMTDHAHSLKLTAGWYGNNCICSEHHTSDPKYYSGDVTALHTFGFDAVKLDGCGVQTDLQEFYTDMQSTGKKYTIENCHWGSKVPFKPNATWCPWHFYRTSGDVRASYSSVVGNLATTNKYATQNLSRPGCWAYPDMLEVGCAHGPGGSHDPGLSDAETRTHFGAWAIVSSPLTLSHDVNNATIMDKIWPVISNTEVIAVNQAYAGHSGSPFKKSVDTVTLGAIDYSALEKGADYSSVGPVEAAAFQYLYKPMAWDGSKTAVLLMNSDTASQDLTVNFADIPGLSCTTCKVRDIWNHKDLGSATTSYTAKAVASHDAAFLVISA